MKLNRIHSESGRSCYAIDEKDTSVKSFVVSTKGTREICNKPEIVGMDYTERLRKAVEFALVHLPDPDLSTISDRKIWELVLLRGGLNFGIRNALYFAHGHNLHQRAFLSSQREKTDEGAWVITEGFYQKPVVVPQRSTLIIGDVVATGTSLENGLKTIGKDLGEGTIENIVCLTIGCSEAERILAGFVESLEAKQGYRANASVVYFEGRFGLVGEDHNLNIGLPGTDFTRFGEGCVLAPEFIASQYENPAHPLERCTIYDAGSRAFEVGIHVEDVIEYWEQVAGLAREGLTYNELVRERFPQYTPPPQTETPTLLQVCEERLNTMRAFFRE